MKKENLLYSYELIHSNEIIDRLMSDSNLNWSIDHFQFYYNALPPKLDRNLKNGWRRPLKLCCFAWGGSWVTLAREGPSLELEHSLESGRDTDFASTPLVLFKFVVLPPLIIQEGRIFFSASSGANVRQSKISDYSYSNYRTQGGYI